MEMVGIANTKNEEIYWLVLTQIMQLSSINP